MFCRGENILLFLVQTVGRQLVEQRQYRPSRARSSANAARKSHFGSAEMGLYLSTMQLSALVYH